MAGILLSYRGGLFSEAMLVSGGTYCWWFRNLANQLSLVVYLPLFTTGFTVLHIPWWLLWDFWTTNRMSGSHVSQTDVPPLQAGGWGGESVTVLRIRIHGLTHSMVNFTGVICTYHLWLLFFLMVKVGTYVTYIIRGILWGMVNHHVQKTVWENAVVFFSNRRSSKSTFLFEIFAWMYVWYFFGMSI